MNSGRTDVDLTPEQKIELLEERLRQAEKLTALGELVSTTTHEFNNVLMTILNYAKIGLRHKDEASRDKALDKIHGAAQRAARITNSVLGMARNRGDQLEPTDLASVIEESLILLERELSKYRISLEKQLEKTPPALANGNQIQQVLLNLIINARQAMAEGGQLLIRLHHDAEHDRVVLTVRDNGVGMTAEQLQKIFAPFYTTKSGPDASGKGGTGLGLASCRRIIEAHRGRIRVESSPGVGTAFSIMLPVAGPAPAPVSVPSPLTTMPASSTSETV